MCGMRKETEARAGQNQPGISVDFVHEDCMADHRIGLLVLEPLKEVMVWEHDALQVRGADRIDARRRMKQHPEILSSGEHVSWVGDERLVLDSVGLWRGAAEITQLDRLDAVAVHILAQAGQVLAPVKV